MKKQIALFFQALMLVFMVACSEDDTPKPEDNDDDTDTGDTTSKDYFCELVSVAADAEILFDAESDLPNATLDDLSVLISWKGGGEGSYALTNKTSSPASCQTSNVLKASKLNPDKVDTWNTFYLNYKSPLDSTIIYDLEENGVYTIKMDVLFDEGTSYTNGGESEAANFLLAERDSLPVILVFGNQASQSGRGRYEGWLTKADTWQTVTLNYLDWAGGSDGFGDGTTPRDEVDRVEIMINGGWNPTIEGNEDYSWDFSDYYFDNVRLEK
jgi:hypothetical protein